METKQEKGIEANNQDFKKYEQVNKGQTYHLAEKAEEDLFDDDYKIKTCDMSLFFHEGEDGKQKFAQQLGEAMQGIGFAILTNHGIDASLYDEAEKKTAEVFETTTR